jgi:hypothetical protein
MQDRPIDEGWRFVSICLESEPVDLGDGLNPWEVDWISTAGRITVPHPQYPAARHRMDVWQVADADPPVTFAAGEFSNGVWGFYVPTDPQRPIDPLPGPEVRVESWASRIRRWRETYPE